MDIELTGVDQAKSQVAKNLQAFHKRVNQAAREGMTEAVMQLRQRVAAAMYAAGIKRQSGGTENAILSGNGKPAVYGSDEDSRLTGVVTTVKASEAGKDPRMPMGAWLGKGTLLPAIANRLMVFVAADGKVVFTHRRRAFGTPARPFLDPATEAFDPTFQDILREKLAAAANP